MKGETGNTSKKRCCPFLIPDHQRIRERIRGHLLTIKKDLSVSLSPCFYLVELIRIELTTS